MTDEKAATTETGEAKTSPVPEKIVAFKFYYGRVFYNEQGQVLEEVGEFNSIEQSQMKVDKCQDALKGAWAFALVRTMKRDTYHSPEVWSNAVVFPDGTHRKISNIESAEAAQAGNQGKWLTIEQMNKAHNRIRLVPQTIMPFAGETVYLQKVRYDDIAALHEHLKDVETEVLFCQTKELVPVEAGLYAYMAITPK